MRVHIFFSVHEPLFHAVAQELSNHYGVDSFSGFVWGEDQRRYLEKQNIAYRSLNVFTRDVLPEIGKAKPDLTYLERCESTYGIPLNRMIFSDRMMVEGRDFYEVLRRTELTFRLVERAYQELSPDWIFSEDVSCLTSYIHWAVAQGMKIPFYSIGDGKIPSRIAIYTDRFRQWARMDGLFVETLQRGLKDKERTVASQFLDEFRLRPERPIGMDVRAQLPVANRNDVTRLLDLAKRFRQAPDSPTLKSPAWALGRRATRLYRAYAAQRSGIFDRPVDGERYVLFPLHYQPEASTLVLAPYYLDQLALIEDIAKSLPAGYRLYVKEHMSSRGHRPLSYYRRIRNTFGVRLIGPDEDSWQLVRKAAAVAVITGTMGWEALLFEKPVVTFGQVFYNSFPLVHQANQVPKDQWSDIFRQAIFNSRPDREMLLTYLWCILQSTYPGFIRNSFRFPQVMQPDNVRNLAAALADTVGLSTAVAAAS